MSSPSSQRAGFPLRFDVFDKNRRYFWIDSYLPWVNFSHGKLRILLKMLQVDILAMTQHVLSSNFSIVTQKEAEECDHQTLETCLHKQQEVEITWTKEFFDALIDMPVVSSFGIDYPQANGLLVIKSAIQEDEITQKKYLKFFGQESNEDAKLIENAEDFLYAKFPLKNNDHYVLDIFGFHVSPRRGIKPSLVTSVLRSPAHRSISESLAWKKHKSKTDSWILQPNKKQVPPQALQVERHAIPLRFLYSRFHPSIPFLQDPETEDEHLYTWVGWKTYQKFTDLQILVPEEKKLKTSLKIQPPSTVHNRIPVKFQIDDTVVPLAPYASANKGRRKEKDIQVFFGVASTWSRSTLFDPKHRDYIFQSKLPINKVNMLHLSYPSIPQQSLEKLILYSPNPLVYKNKNSCMRGKTHSDNAVKSWHKT